MATKKGQKEKQWSTKNC